LIPSPSPDEPLLAPEGRSGFIDRPQETAKKLAERRGKTRIRVFDLA
jgi:hypothetical protein